MRRFALAVPRPLSFALASLLALGAGACAESGQLNLDAGSNGAAGTGGNSGAGSGGRGGTSAGTAGSGGSSATAGTGGAGGNGGGAGTGGTAGSSGGGAAGRGGSSGGTGGSSAGTAGRGGSGGTAGGAAGRGGTGGGAAGAAGRGGTVGAGGSAGTMGTGGRGGTVGTAGAGGSAAGGKGGGTGSGGSSGSGGSASGGSGGAAPWNAGNPNGSCSAGVPTMAQAASTSNPTAVIGNGTAASCTFAALQTAATAGGVITFNCGADPVTILVTATLNVPSTKNTVIDGGRKITLDGGGAVQIMRFYSGNYRANDNTLTLQHIAMVNGKTTPTMMIPTAPAPCSQGYNDGEGGALYMRDGNLVVVDSIFTNNQGAPLGPDTGGGAIYVLGSKNGVWISGSTFTNNSASNAGAVGCLQSPLNIYNSLFTGNKAIGHDANNNEPSKCSAINNNQNETGSGGNGGAIYSDGEGVNLLVCGDWVTNNAAGMNAFGGGLFFTSNDFGGTLTITDTTMTGNTGGYWTQSQADPNASAGKAVGTNCKSLTITNSTLQGLNGVP